MSSACVNLYVTHMQDGKAECCSTEWERARKSVRPFFDATSGPKYEEM